MLKYKGYMGHVEFDDETGIFHGEGLDLRDVITFQGKSVEEIERAFRDPVDDYLEFCQERGEEPDKPFFDCWAKVSPTRWYSASMSCEITNRTLPLRHALRI